MNLCQRPVSRRGQAQLPDVADLPAQDRRVEGVGQPRGQLAQRDGDGEDRQPEQVTGDDVYRAPHSQRRPCAVLTQIDGDLAAGVAEADDQDGLAAVGRAVPVFRAV